jgi:aromatic ring-opening dioxygenase catalytic subunit (LigB family)
LLQAFFVTLQAKEHNQVMDVLNEIYVAIAAEGFTAHTLQIIDNYANDIQNGREDFLDSIYQSMQDSAREARLSLGRPSSHATHQQALEQVAMLKAAREAQQTGK